MTPSHGRTGRATDEKRSGLASQLIMFRNMSRLPPIAATEFEAKSESPTTTSRVSGVLGFSSLLSGAGGGVAPSTGAVTATAIESGPCTSPLSSSGSASPLVVSRARSLSAQLLRPLMMIDVAVRPFAAPSIGFTERVYG